MEKILLGSVVAFALTTSSLSANPVFQPHVGDSAVTASDHLWLAKNDKGKGKKPKMAGGGKPAKAKGKPEHAGGNKKPKNAGNGNAQAAAGKPDKPAAAANGNGNGNGNVKAANGNGNGKIKAAAGPKWSDAERQEVVERVVQTTAPESRDMARILGLTGLALATPQLVVAEVPDDELIGYANCPPGLAKKDPPCVPPGLARKGVTSDEWLGYDEDRYDDIWIERRGTLLDAYDIPDADGLLLRSEDIAELYGLAPAPDGQRYGLVDGLPILLDQDDYASLLLLNELAEVTTLGDGLRVAPTAALTQSELMSLYRLPQLSDGQNYSVVNGQILQLNDDEYELLQLIRIARAVL